MQPELPVKFGKYTLIRHLATGGMAELYLAIQKSISGFEKLTVIKKILPRYSSDQEFINMFLDEARIAATLNHPNIVQIFDVGSIGNDYFIAMEYIHGEDLRNIVGAMRKKEIRSFPLEHAIAIIAGVCKGLSYAHNHKSISGEPLNIVHRDISPQNILVTFSGEVKIVDFGIARAATKDVAQGIGKGEGALRGKFPYMSPEQIKGLEIDKRSDIFSTGIILFELTTGRRLFKGANELETLRKIVDLDYPKPSSIVAGYPLELEKIVMTALQKDRDLRYQDALAMQQDLEEFTRNKKLKVSTIELGKFMEELFKEKLQQEKEALKEGKKLADIIAEKEAGEFSFEEFLDLSSLPSSGGMTPKAISSDSSISQILAQPQLPRKRNTLLWGVVSGAIAITITIGAILTYLLWKNHTSSSQNIGKITIKTEPPGAAVYIDGDRWPGQTPLSVEKLKPDVTYSVSIKLPGFESVSRDIVVTRRQPEMQLDLKLEPVRTNAMAVLKIEASDPSATFIIDGKKLDAKGQVTVDSISPDVPHTILVQAPEFIDYSEKIILSPGEVKELKVDLKPRPINPNEFLLVVKTDPEGAIVAIDGKKLDGMTPGKWRIPWKSSVNLIIEKEKFKNKERVIQPEKGGKVEIEEKLERRKTEIASSSPESAGKEKAYDEGATLYLDSEPWSNVTIQGVGKFQTPIANLKVPSGNLKITLENPAAGLKKTITIKMEPGSTVRKKVNLKE